MCCKEEVQRVLVKPGGWGTEKETRPVGGESDPAPTLPGPLGASAGVPHTKLLLWLRPQTQHCLHPKDLV